MKSLLILFSVVVYFISASAYREPPFYYFDSYINFTAIDIASRIKFSDANGVSYLEKTGIKFDQCLDGIFAVKIPDPAINYEGFCKYFSKKEILGCYKNAMGDLLQGFKKNELYLSYYFLNAYHFAYEEFCGNDGVSNTQYLIDLSKSKVDYDCFQNITTQVYLEATCLTDLKVLRDINEGVFHLTKEDVCSDLESVQSCLYDLTKSNCKADYSRVFELVFRPLTEECNSLHDKNFDL